MTTIFIFTLDTNDLQEDIRKIQNAYEERAKTFVLGILDIQKRLSDAERKLLHAQILGSHTEERITTLRDRFLPEAEPIEEGEQPLFFLLHALQTHENAKAQATFLEAEILKFKEILTKMNDDLERRMNV